MKFRLEISPLCEEEEILLRCREPNARTRELENILSSLADSPSDMVLHLGDTEYYVPKSEILFFETVDGKVAAHTKDRMYYTRHRLQALEALLPHSFLRVSKSCILNAEAVYSLSRGLTGTGEVTFAGTDKKVYISRAYHRYLKERIYQLRFPEEQI